MPTNLDSNLKSTPLREDLKLDTNVDNVFDTNNNANNDDESENVIPKPENPVPVTDKQPTSTDGPPDDIRAFYGHPLTAATASVNAEDTHASAVALLHEYINLPALDRSGMKIGDKINSIYDIMRDDGSAVKGENGQEVDSDYMQMLQTTLASEVDKFFNRDCGEDSTSVIEVNDSNCPVSIPDDVIHEVSVETTCLENGSIGTDLYAVASTSSSLVESGSNLTHITMPSLEDVRNNIPAQACSASRVHAAVPSRNDKVTSTGSRRSRDKEQVNAKTQEISKKLVEALSKKLMKRMNNKEATVPNSNSEVESAVSSLTNITNNTPSMGSLDKMSQSSDVSSMKAMTVEQNHESILDNLPENLPIIEANNLDTSPLPPLSTFSVTTQSQTAFHRSCSASPSTLSSGSIHSMTKSDNVDSVSSTHRPRLVQIEPLSAHAPNQINKQGPGQFLRNNSVPAANPNLYRYSAPTEVTHTYTGTQTSQAVYYYPDNPQTILNVFPNPPRLPQHSNGDNDIMLQRYIQQQNRYEQDIPTYKPPGVVKDTYSLKSPDSGYGESCDTTKDQSHVPYTEMTDNDVDKQNGGKVAKRRKSAPPMYVRQYWNPLDKLGKSVVPKLEKDPAGYKYYLECPISTTQRIEEDRITYLNKGQYYGLTLEHDGLRNLKCQSVKSIIMVVFREDKHLDDERKAWEFWHSRQHSYKQRVIDIDTKNSVNINPNCTEEISYNAVSVKWNPRESPVKGLPLHIQIDTYENSSKDTPLISRGFCQIKVFCDKGAERKIRDEERRKQCRVSKTETHAPTKAIRKRHEEVYHEALDRSEFYPMADLKTQPILFTPTFECDDSTRQSPIILPVQDEDGSSSITSSGDHYDSAEDGATYPAKRARTEPCVPFQTYSNILLYVREKHEVVFTAVMLRSPTLHGLLQAVEEKYNVPISKIKNSYKRSKKGILVRLDDNIIRHYSHESTFIIELNRDDQEYELILTEIDPC
ncbi:Grainyhead-like protein 2 [Mactra antiquata]